MGREEIIQQALSRLTEALPGSDFELKAESTSKLGSAGRHDSTLTLRVGRRNYRFRLEAKRHLPMNTVARVAMELESTEIQNDQILFVAEYIQPSVQQLLQARGFNYLDAAGNCHIRREPLFVHVEGHRPERLRRQEKIRAFAGEGLKVIFTFLLDPSLVTNTYRDLAEMCDVSHGVVQYTMGDLEETGYLERISRTERRLKRTDGLLDRWVEGYVEALRPKLSLGRFRFRDKTLDEWKELDFDPGQFRWGGEPAASLITEYLRPGYLTLYARPSRPEVMRYLQLLPDDEGRLEIFRTFWTPKLEDREQREFEGSTVPAVLAYADLAALDDPRIVDVAGRLRKRISSAAGEREPTR